MHTISPDLYIADWTHQGSNLTTSSYQSGSEHRGINPVGHRNRLDVTDMMIKFYYVLQATCSQQSTATDDTLIAVRDDD